jgi:alkanesulfonate monooxygenase SsuD/methylene tetrahydromethanopterin reductase-like flavin-dependent oxidoreductase (luciferase family)
MEIAIFHGSPEDVEKQVNDWLKCHDTVIVFNMTQSTSHTTFLTLSILYS